MYRYSYTLHGHNGHMVRDGFIQGLAPALKGLPDFWHLMLKEHETEQPDAFEDWTHATQSPPIQFACRGSYRDAPNERRSDARSDLHSNRVLNQRLVNANRHCGSTVLILSPWIVHLVSSSTSRFLSVHQCTARDSSTTLRLQGVPCLYQTMNP